MFCVKVTDRTPIFSESFEDAQATAHRAVHQSYSAAYPILPDGLGGEHSDAQRAHYGHTCEVSRMTDAGGIIAGLPGHVTVEVLALNVPRTNDGYAGKDGRPGTLDEVPDEDHAWAYLMQGGNLRCFSVYGSYTDDCVPIALAVWRIMQDSSGEPGTYCGLHSDMGCVVNESDSVATLIYSHGTPEDIALLDAAGIDRADYADMLQEDC